ncbi:hypothetical protein M406DRAFT_75459 [Cryphonectria parasitica EP155]|uniref:Uncharacterized protein n=1 Tax=Cryphonectria parasitica (strain ATCC 38755 / EP155) TaxID=660469 RepID=A0A9P4XSG5_CRYP1|nr:uncharacterized protein M406DRAFT_75459 [Cryphonectria parasitica EP155]KAF3760108.1 hypothetical protein M406DRAFT_75459 [Cryphonectria parasitica EP155]
MSLVTSSSSSSSSSYSPSSISSSSPSFSSFRKSAPSVTDMDMESSQQKQKDAASPMAGPSATAGPLQPPTDQRSPAQKSNDTYREQIEKHHSASLPFWQFEAQLAVEFNGLLRKKEKTLECVTRSMDYLDTAFSRVRLSWENMGIWNYQWSGFPKPASRWRHEDPTVPQDWRAEKTRPIEMFEKQVFVLWDSEIPEVQVPTCGCAAVDKVRSHELARILIRNTWKARGIWDIRWGKQPGNTWKHERPLADFLNDPVEYEYESTDVMPKYDKNAPIESYFPILKGDKVYPVARIPRSDGHTDNKPSSSCVAATTTTSNSNNTNNNNNTNTTKPPTFTPTPFTIPLPLTITPSANTAPEASAGPKPTPKPSLTGKPKLNMIVTPTTVARTPPQGNRPCPRFAPYPTEARRRGPPNARPNRRRIKVDTQGNKRDDYWRGRQGLSDRHDFWSVI